MARWLVALDLGALGFECARSSDPELAARLRPAAAGAAAGNLAHLQELDRIERRFAGLDIAMVLLKGAAVSESAYSDWCFRPMTDLDVWVRNEDMSRAGRVLIELGYLQEAGRPDRPPALQSLCDGELIFSPAQGRYGLVELHFGPFQGWWAWRTARPDADALWRRAEPVGPGRHARRLAVEDAVLQTALHVVASQFGQAPLRGLMDLAVMARRHRIDWEEVGGRARDWRMATAVWLVLDTADRLIGLPGSASALRRLRPPAMRRAALRAFVTPEAILAGRDLTRASRRHLLLLALVDRARDGARLLGRTLWPEKWWIAARYGRQVGRVAHLRGLIRRGAA